MNSCKVSERGQWRGLELGICFLKIMARSRCFRDLESRIAQGNRRASGDGGLDGLDRAVVGEDRLRDAVGRPGVRGEGVAPLDRERHVAGEGGLAAGVGDFQRAGGAARGEHGAAADIGILRGGEFEEVDLAVVVGIEGVGGIAAVRRGAEVCEAPRFAGGAGDGDKERVARGEHAVTHADGDRGCAESIRSRSDGDGTVRATAAEDDA